MAFGNGLIWGDVTGVNAAHVEAIPNSIMKRDASGRAQVAAPSANEDIANKQYVDETSAADLAETTGRVDQLEDRVYLVDSWRSEDNLTWYRKYSDGWIEQGGYITGAGIHTITFVAPFLVSHQTRSIKHDLYIKTIRRNG